MYLYLFFLHACCLVGGGGVPNNRHVGKCRWLAQMNKERGTACVCVYFCQGALQDKQLSCLMWVLVECLHKRILSAALWQLVNCKNWNLLSAVNTKITAIWHDYSITMLKAVLFITFKFYQKSSKKKKRCMWCRTQGWCGEGKAQAGGDFWLRICSHKSNKRPGENCRPREICTKPPESNTAFPQVWKLPPDWPLLTEGFLSIKLTRAELNCEQVWPFRKGIKAHCFKEKGMIWIYNMSQKTGGGNIPVWLLCCIYFFPKVIGSQDCNWK